MVTPAGRRAQVRYAIRRQLSARRACALLGVPRSTLGYRARRGDADGPLLAELRRLAARHPRYGYRRIWALLWRAGRRVNPKRVYRLWHLAGLALPRRRPRRKVRTGRRVDPLATGPNAVWTYDFVHDWAARGGRFKCLSEDGRRARRVLALRPLALTPARLPALKYKHPRTGVRGRFGRPNCWSALTAQAACSVGTRWCQWSSPVSSSAAQR